MYFLALKFSARLCFRAYTCILHCFFLVCPQRAPWCSRTAPWVVSLVTSLTSSSSCSCSSVITSSRDLYLAPRDWHETACNRNEQQRHACDIIKGRHARGWEGGEKIWAENQESVPYASCQDLKRPLLWLWFAWKTTEWARWLWTETRVGCSLLLRRQSASANLRALNSHLLEAACDVNRALLPPFVYWRRKRKCCLCSWIRVSMDLYFLQTHREGVRDSCILQHRSDRCRFVKQASFTTAGNRVFTESVFLCKTILSQYTYVKPHWVSIHM